MTKMVERPAQQDATRLDWLAGLGQFLICEGADGHDWAVCKEDFARGYRRVIPLGVGIDLRDAIDKAMMSPLTEFARVR